MAKSVFFGMVNIGPATAADLARLGITSLEKLKECDAYELYDRISTLDGIKHDICVLDTFTAIIENAKTGEAKPWWYYSRLRKGEYQTVGRTFLSDLDIPARLAQ